MKNIAILLHLSLVVLYFYMAEVQLNDPDPLYWICTYGFAALFPLSRVFGRDIAKFAPFALGLVVAGLLASAPGFLDYLRSGDYSSLTGSMSLAPYVEYAREFLGLIIATVGILFYWLRPSGGGRSW